MFLIYVSVKLTLFQENREYPGESQRRAQPCIAVTLPSHYAIVVEGRAAGCASPSSGSSAAPDRKSVV